MSAKRTCVICGARVRNQNPNTKTCSPECTAKYRGKPDPEPRFPTCCKCGVAVEDGESWCDNCASFHLNH